MKIKKILDDNIDYLNSSKYREKVRRNEDIELMKKGEKSINEVYVKSTSNVKKDDKIAKEIIGGVLDKSDNTKKIKENIKRESEDNAEYSKFINETRGIINRSKMTFQSYEVRENKLSYSYETDITSFEESKLSKEDKITKDKISKEYNKDLKMLEKREVVEKNRKREEIYKDVGKQVTDFRRIAIVDDPDSIEKFKNIFMS